MNENHPDITRRYLAYFDIMGFKHTLARNGHKDVLHKMLTMSRILKDIKDNSSINIIKTDVDTNVPQKSKISIKTLFYSDSILFYTNNDDVLSADTIIEWSSIFLAECFSRKIPIKGALSYGSFTAIKSKSIYFGQPLIDAFHLQEELMLYGAIIHNTMEDRLSNELYSVNDYLVKYKTPLKHSNATHYAIKWSKHLSSVNSINLIESFYKTVSGSSRTYIDNTIDFINKTISI